MSHAGTGSVAAALDRIEAQLAFLTAQQQRILAAIERIGGKPPPTDAERNATRR